MESCAGFIAPSYSAFVFMRFFCLSCCSSRGFIHKMKTFFFPQKGVPTWTQSSPKIVKSFLPNSRVKRRGKPLFFQRGGSFHQRRLPSSLFLMWKARASLLSHPDCSLEPHVSPLPWRWCYPPSHWLNYPWNILPHAFSDDASCGERLSGCAFEPKERKSGKRNEHSRRIKHQRELSAVWGSN